MSAPVQKSRSFPARTIARTVWSASARCRNVRSASQLSKSMALRRAGRSSVNTATAPVVSKRTPSTVTESDTSVYRR